MIHRPRPYRSGHTPGKMNGLETDYSERLEMVRLAGHIVRWRFESVRLKLAKKTTYLPDFAVTYDDHVELHEVKGRWLSSARVKWKLAAELYPEFRFIAVTRVDGNWIEEAAID